MLPSFSDLLIGLLQLPLLCLLLLSLTSLGKGTSKSSPPIQQQSEREREREEDEIGRLSRELDLLEREKEVVKQRLDELEARRLGVLSLIEALNLNRQYEEEEKARRMFNCQICLEDHEINGCYTLECDHRFCQDRLSGYICSKINSHEVGERMMVCPLPDCGIPISHPIIRGCTKDLNNLEAYQKYCEFTKDDYIAAELQKGSASKGTCLIRCPSETCNYVFYFNLSSSRPFAFNCEACNQSYCFNCQVIRSAEASPSVSPIGGSRISYGPGHAPHSCAEQLEIITKNVEEKRKLDEWRELNANGERLLEELMREKGWKACPNCSTKIERIRGCDHMTCEGCGCHFCYFCQRYDKTNPTNRGDCKNICPQRKT